MNRSHYLSDVLYNLFGKASKIYVPKMDAKNGVTSHARMFETAIPYAVTYGIEINSNYDQKNYKGVVKSVNERDGVVLMVWNHSKIADLAKAFGVKDPKKWADDDYDSVWVINPKTGSIHYTQENIKPNANCPQFNSGYYMV